MNKSKKCADKAASILKNHCKKKTNKLVYNDFPKLPRGHCQPIYVPKISRTCGTRIRYCTAKELKLMTGGRLCDCPDSSGPFTAGRFLADLLRNAAKAMVVLAAAYTTYDLGFWGLPKDTQATFAGLCEAMPCRPDPCQRYQFKPKSRECEEALDLLGVPPNNPCQCDDPIPINMEKCCHKMKQAWNHSVIFIFEGIANGPTNVVNFFVRKWREVSSTECDPCIKSLVSQESEITSKECELIDDYDEKYSKEEQDECKVAEEQLEALLELEEQREEQGETEEILPPYGY